jgi:hypothetical protein
MTTRALAKRHVKQRGLRAKPLAEGLADWKTLAERLRLKMRRRTPPVGDSTLKANMATMERAVGGGGGALGSVTSALPKPRVEGPALRLCGADLSDRGQEGCTTVFTSATRTPEPRSASPDASFNRSQLDEALETPDNASSWKLRCLGESAINL